MTKTVAFMYYEARNLTRSLYGGNFHAPAVAKGEKPFLLEVRDHVQPEKQPHIVGGRIVPRTITGEEIALDIIQHWTAGVLGMTGDVRPGIWVVRDTIPMLDDNGTPLRDVYGIVQTRPATEAEKAAMWAEDLAENTGCQARWGDYNILQGDVYHGDSNTKMRLLINPTMKASARYYGREREWLDEVKDDDVRTCVFCGKSTDTRFPVCQNCDRVIDKAKFDALNAKAPMTPPLNPSEKKQAA